MMNSKILVAFNVLVFLLGLSAISLHADTLRLKSGQALDGTYLGGNADSIQFRVRGTARTFRLSEVDQIQFADDDEGPGTGANQNMVPFTNSFLEMMRPGDWQITDMGAKA
jgi:hypothetical protein